MSQNHHVRPVAPLGTSHRQQQHQPIQPKSSSSKTALLILGFIGAIGLGYFAGLIQSDTGLISTSGDLDLSSVQETYATLVQNYDGEIDEQALIDGANSGMVDALGDDYTVYLTAEEAEAFNASLSGNVGSGVGIEIGLRNDQPTVLRLLRDNPAEEAGLQAGDIIIAVNGESTIDYSVTDTANLIRGEEGTTVKITVFRGGEELDYSITRATINNPSVYTSIEDGVGVMTITRFDSDTGDLAREAAQEFLDESADRVVLDLRGNGGGYVDAAQDVAGIWLNDKLVVVEKEGATVVEELTTGNDALLEGVPTVVLVNESSASASEIVTGALSDHGAATIVGTTTFGKGSVQQLLTLSTGATLKVTIARWYTPNGLNISEQGIEPDVLSEITAEDINAGNDPQLDAAIKAVQDQ